MICSHTHLTSRDSYHVSENIKCVIVGDAEVGKTSMLYSFSTNTFPEDYIPTVFDNFSSDIIQNHTLCHLGLWDTAGQDEFIKLRPMSYDDSDVFVICFSIEKRASLENVEKKWYPEIIKHTKKRFVPIVLIALKTDLRTDLPTLKRLDQLCQIPISRTEGLAVAQKLNLSGYLECSGKTQIGLTNVFNKVALLGLRRVRLSQGTNFIHQGLFKEEKTSCGCVSPFLSKFWPFKRRKNEDDFDLNEFFQKKEIIPSHNLVPPKPIIRKTILMEQKKKKKMDELQEIERIRQKRKATKKKSQLARKSKRFESEGSNELKELDEEEKELEKFMEEIGEAETTNASNVDPKILKLKRNEEDDFSQSLPNKKEFSRYMEKPERPKNPPPKMKPNHKKSKSSVNTQKRKDRLRHKIKYKKKRGPKSMDMEASARRKKMLAKRIKEINRIKSTNAYSKQKRIPMKKKKILKKKAKSTHVMTKNIKKPVLKQNAPKKRIIYMGLSDGGSSDSSDDDSSDDEIVRNRFNHTKKQFPIRRRSQKKKIVMFKIAKPRIKINSKEIDVDGMECNRDSAMYLKKNIYTRAHSRNNSKKLFGLDEANEERKKKLKMMFKRRRETLNMRISDDEFSASESSEETEYSSDTDTDIENGNMI